MNINEIFTKKKMSNNNVTENDQKCIIGVAEVEGSNKHDQSSKLMRSAGTVWTASAHMILTAFIGYEVLSLSWVMAQLGWLVGPVVLVLFSFVTYYTSCLLASCYHLGDPDTLKRNYTYMEVVHDNLGGFKTNVCSFIQYLHLIGATIGYAIAASMSMIAIKRSSCFHEKGHDNPCKVSGTTYMLMFGALEILLSQIPDFDQISWLSVMAAVMSFTYSIIGLGLGIAKVAANGEVKGRITGIISIGNLTPTQKLWNAFQALRAIAFAYSYSLVLIQDKLKAPNEHKTMKKSRMVSVVTTTIFYMLCGCFGYAAFGDMAPRNLLTGVGFFDPYWLVDIANATIVIHLVWAYQVSCQPLFAFVESTAVKYFPESKFINNNIEIPIPISGYKPFKLNMFQLSGRSALVCMTTLSALLMPFFNDVVGIIGAFGFWPLTVYFPIEIYIVQKKIPRWSARWILLQLLSVVCLIISVCVVTGSIAGVVSDLKNYKPFKTM